MRKNLFITIVFLAFVPAVWSQISSQNKRQKPTAVLKRDLKSEVQFRPASQFANNQLSYKIIPAANDTFCYDVFADGKILIHQPSKPGLPGNDGFKTKADAKKVAKLIINKIKNGEMPPTVTTDELKKLNVL